MKYKPICILLIMSIMIIMNSNMALADIDDNIDLDDYDYVKYAESFFSDGEETKKLYPGDYFNDEFEQIYSISISNVVVEGIDARGAILEYLWINSKDFDYLMPIPSLNEDEKLNGIFMSYGLQRSVISLKADTGELWFKYITGTVNGYSYILIFDESGSGNHPSPDPEPEPPEPVENIEVDSIAGDIIVNWDPVDGADGYKVYIDGDPVDVGDTTRYVFSADPGEYEIQVVAYNDDGQSPKGNPITVVRPEDNPVIIIQPPACEPPPVLDVNIVGAENPIPIYFPNIPEPPEPPVINPLPDPDYYIPDANDFDMTPDMPSYNPRHYDPDRDGPILEYNPPPLNIPEPIESPGPLPNIPDPMQFIMPHDEPINKDNPKSIENPIISENPININEPKTPEEPRQVDPIEIEPPRISDPVVMDPPREMTGYEPEPPREMTGYNPESPYIPDPPKKMDPPR